MHFIEQDIVVMLPKKCYSTRCYALPFIFIFYMFKVY